ncbi:MAG: CpaE family protein [Rhodoglobus sp.]
MVALIFGLPADQDARLRNVATRHGHEVVASGASAQELEVVVRALRPTAAVVSASPQYLTSRVLAACDDVGVRIVALVGGEVERRHAASVGLYETTDATADWPTIELMLGGARGPAPVSSSPATSSPAPRGQVISVWGPSGAPGRTTLAIGIASELAALGHRVVLADVDTHGASVAPTLGLLDEAPGFAAACRLAGSETLTSEELDRVSETYQGASSFRVLTGIGAPRRWPELSAERVSGVIARCREWVDYTVLDTASSLENDEEISSDLFAPRRNAATVAALREADRVVAVGSADPVGMSRFLRAHVELLEASGTPRVEVVMNRVRASAIGLGPAAQVRQTLARFGGIDDPVLVPHDQNAVDGAVLSGRTLLDVSPRSGARRAIADLVSLRLAPGTAHETPAPGAEATRGRRRR